MNQKRMLHIDISKSVAIIWIVYGHAIVQLSGTQFYTDYLDAQTTFMFSLFSFRMPLLFMISGAFHRKRLEYNFSTHKGYLSKVSQTILLPFYSLSILFLLINIAMSKYLNAPSLGDMVFSLLLQQSNDNILPSGVMWFLFTLFSCSIITYVAIRILKIKPTYLLAFAFVLKISSGYLTDAYFLSINTTSSFLFFFVLGYTFDKYVIQKPIYQWKYLCLFFVSYLILLTVYFNISSFSPVFVAVFNFVKSFEIMGILVTLLIFGLSHHAAHYFGETRWLKFFIYCGTSSMLIYVFHMPTFTILNKIADFANVNPNSTKLLLLFIPGVIFPLIYGKILSYNKLAYKLLIGRDPR
ncbi:MAG: acyltransferase [Calditrichaeota bacterium]|nr:MAG: acyltransferase [Calditrichota bacterium]